MAAYRWVRPRSTQPGAATLAVADYALPQGANSIAAVYSGDGNYGGSASSLSVTIALPPAGSAVAPSFSANPVYPYLAAAGQPEWSVTVTLHNLTSTATALTGFTVDGTDNSPQISGLFGSSPLAGNGSVLAHMSFANLAAPLNRVFGFSGVDAGGRTWSVQSTVMFSNLDKGPGVTLTAEPAVVARNPAADPSCQWAQQFTVESALPNSFLTTLTAAGDDGSVDDLS